MLDLSDDSLQARKNCIKADSAGPIRLAESDIVSVLFPCLPSSREKLREATGTPFLGPSPEGDAASTPSPPQSRPPSLFSLEHQADPVSEVPGSFPGQAFDFVVLGLSQVEQRLCVPPWPRDTEMGKAWSPDRKTGLRRDSLNQVMSSRARIS